MTEQSGIYSIKHIATGRVYVGSASNISKRWSRHRKDLRSNQHSNKHLQAAWNKYGETAFVFEVIELTNDLTQREQFWIDNLHALDGFNIAPTARSSRGRKWSEQERAQRTHANNTSQLNTPQAVKKRLNARRRDGTLGQKVTWKIACQIRQEYGDIREHWKGGKQAKHGGVTLASLGAKYGISYVTVYDIVHWNTWKEPPDVTSSSISG